MSTRDHIEEAKLALSFLQEEISISPCKVKETTSQGFSINYDQYLYTKTETISPAAQEVLEEVQLPPPSISIPEKKLPPVSQVINPPTPPVPSQQSPFFPKERGLRIVRAVHKTIDTLPSDHLATFHRFAYTQMQVKAPCIIIAEKKEQLAFLQNIALAIEKSFIPAQVLEAEKLLDHLEWKTLLQHRSLIIAPSSLIWNDPSFVKMVKATPQRKEIFLCDSPLLLLAEIDLYRKKPDLKRALWNQLRLLLQK